MKENADKSTEKLKKPIQLDFFAYLDNPLKIESELEAIAFYNSLTQARKNAWLLCILLALARGDID